MKINPEKVPAEPVHSVLISTTGAVTIDGREVVGTSDNPRINALDELERKAAWRGRPVRAIAKDPDGTTWPLIVGPDGEMITLSQPHPAPASAGTPTPAGPTRVEQLWRSPLPSHHRELWRRVQGAKQNGDVLNAVLAVQKLEADLTEEFGAHHPYTVNVLTERALLALMYADQEKTAAAWREGTGAAIEAALRRHTAHAVPRQDTDRHARNACAAWDFLRTLDPEAAAALSPSLRHVLSLSGEEAAARRVAAWTPPA